MDLGSVMKQLEAGIGSFCQADMIPQHSEEYSNRISLDFEDTAIVIQGPLCMDGNFTLETVRLYKKWYPNAITIVSTWANEDADTLTALQSAGAIVLKNTPPENPGYLNINMQLTSSANGVYKAKDLGAKYVLKTRTDQRFCNRGFLDILHHQLILYPVKIDCMSGRITTLFAFPHIAGYVSDFLYFGYIDDIEKLLCIPNITVDETAIADSDSSTAILKNEFSSYLLENFIDNIDAFSDEGYKTLSDKCIFPEAYIIKKYMKDVLQTDTALSDYYNFIKNGMIITDSKMLGFYWRKRQCAFITRSDKCLYSNAENEILYTDWLRLYLSGAAL